MHTAVSVLLLKRSDDENFWQSVSGTLEWGESAMHAARRELTEETGIAQVAIRSTGISRSFEIVGLWRDRYHASVTRNREHLFYCKLEQESPVRLNPAEHAEYRWLDFRTARKQASSWTNRLAIESLS